MLFGKKSILLFTITLVLTFIFSTFLFYYESQKIKNEPITAWTEDHEADCAIVLTGGPGRVREGFDLLARKSVKKLIISGVHPKAQLREIFPRWPYYQNLKKEDIILERNSNTTYGNAQQTLIITEALRCRDVILITSRTHMYRAYKTFRAMYPEGFPILKRSTHAGSVDTSIFDLFIETTKSFFYSLWFY